MENIIILGFDGYAKSVIDTICESELAEEIVILDKLENLGKKYSKACVKGCSDDLEEYYVKGYRRVHIVNEMELEWRKNMAEKVKSMGFSLVTIVDKSAMVASDAVVGLGTYIAKGAIVEPSSVISENVIVNVGAVIQSDCTIGAHSRISTAAAVCEGAVIGEMCYIGAKAVVENKAHVPDGYKVNDVEVFSV